MAPKQTTKQKEKVADMDRSELEEVISKVVGNAVKCLQTTIESLREEVVCLKSALDEKDQEINELSVRLDEIEQYGRRNNVRIFGIPEKDNEDTDQVVLNVARKVKVDLEQSSIDRSHRVGKKGTKPRPIIVKFVSYAARRAVFSAKRHLKGTGITIREDLTQSRLQLLKKAVDAYSFENVWTSDGVILIKIGGVRLFRVRSDADLETLMEKHPPST